jgi:accessory gene regulator B
MSMGVMSMTEYLISKVIDFLKKNMDEIDNDKEEILKYGLDIIIYNGLLLILFFALAVILGVVKPFVVSFAVYGTLRIAAGGAHAKTRTICFMVTISTFFGAIFMAKYFAVSSIFPSVIIFLLNISAIIIYAPGDTLEKPIISNRIKFSRKLASIFVSAVIFLISVKVYSMDVVLYSVILFSEIPFILLLIPVGYRLLGCLPGNGKIEES